MSQTFNGVLCTAFPQHLVAELYSHEFEGDWCKMQLCVVITDSQGNHITADLM